MQNQPRSTFRSRSTSGYLAVVTVTVMTLAAQEGEKAWDLKTPQPVARFRPETLDRLDELSCTECHAEIVEEWASSAHALSWVDEVYREEIADRRRPDLCHACHIPEPLLLDGLVRLPKARSEDLHFGVTCNTCHLGPGGAQHGPHGVETDDHPTRRDDLLTSARSSALCATCHRTNIGPVLGIAKDFEASGQAARGRSCVGCHMAIVEREGLASDDEAALPSGRFRRSHALQTPRDPTFLRRAFRVSAHRHGGGTRVVLANAAGHRVPGLKGRELAFEATLLDDQGQVVERGELTIDTRFHVPVGGEAEILLDASGTEVHLSGIHGEPRLDEPVLFLNERLTVTSAD